MATKVTLEHGARVIFGSDFVFRRDACQSNCAESCLDGTGVPPVRFVDPKGKKAKKVAAAATSTGFDDKGMPVVIDWHYAMAELSRKNGVPVLCQCAFGGDMLTSQLDTDTAGVTPLIVSFQRWMQKKRSGKQERS